jgi:AraC-like DNA-binding protein
MLERLQPMRERRCRTAIADTLVAVDVLSDAITAMRTGRPHSARVRRQGAFVRRFPQVDAAGFHVMLQGACWLIPRGDPPIHLGAGDVVFLPRGSAHALADSLSTRLADRPPAPLAQGRPDRDGEVAPTGPGRDNVAGDTVVVCGAYLMDRSRSHPLLTELPEVIHLQTRFGRHPGLHAAFALLGRELEHPRPGAAAAVPALLDTLLLYILRAWFDDQSGNQPCGGWAAALQDRAIAAALQAIHSDPGRQWTVEELGQHVGLSRAAFARRFSTLVGQPPLTYVRWWRMITAARLLCDSDLPLGVVAKRIGYTSEFAFANAFKRAHGVAPGRYRRQRTGRIRTDG